jgi:signal peptidase
VLAEESKVLKLNSENQAVSSNSIKRQKKRINLIDSNLAQPSVLSPQSSDANSLNFEQVCTELLRKGHQIKFKAPGDSMYPTICDGDLITVQPIKPSDIIIGDIIFYRHKSGVVAHRVVNIQAPQSSVPSPQYFFTLRGDAAIVLDNPVGTDQILGKVVSVERNGRCIDPYSLQVKFLYKARRLASRLKRLFFSHRRTQTNTENFLC